MLNDIMSKLQGGDVFNPLGSNLAAFADRAPAVMPQLAATSGLVADPNTPPGVQTMGAPAPVDPRMGGGQGPGQARPNFGSYIPQGLVQMLMRMQAQRPEIFANMIGGGMGQRFGLTPETDLANLYTRNMARQDYRSGTDPMAAGSILTPEQRAGYPTRPMGMANAAGLAPMPDFTGGVGNQAPNAQGNIQRPMGMAERKAPSAGGSGY